MLSLLIEKTGGLIYLEIAILVLNLITAVMMFALFIRTYKRYKAGQTLLIVILLLAFVAIAAFLAGSIWGRITILK